MIQMRVQHPRRCVSIASLLAAGARHYNVANPSLYDAHFIEVEVPAVVPSKKNQLAPKTGGGLTYQRGVKDILRTLQHYVELQWKRPPVLHPAVQFWFSAQMRQDRDGMQTTIIDVLRRAKVIHDDSIEKFNGLLIIHPAQIGPSSARLRIEWTDHASC